MYNVLSEIAREQAGEVEGCSRAFRNSVRCHSSTTRSASSCRPLLQRHRDQRLHPRVQDSLVPVAVAGPLPNPIPPSVPA